MTDQDRNIEAWLASAEMTAKPNPVRMLTVQNRVLAIARGSRVRRRVRRAAGWGVLLLAGAATAGFAGTETGRSLFRRIVTPVWTSQVVMYSPEPDQDASGPSGSQAGMTGDGGDSQPCDSQQVGGAQGKVIMGITIVSRTDGDTPPVPPEQAADMQAEMAEVLRIQQSGGGRVIGLMEGVTLDGDHPDTSFRVEYTLNSGKTVPVGGDVTRLQRRNMRIDEILKLRDSGAGQIVSSQPSSLGLGRYTIRFTLSDGTDVDLETYYPPGTREEREQIYTETRELKAAGQFTVEQAHSDPQGEAWGRLRYKLADGRTVGITEQVPSDVITADGKQVITFETQSDSAASQP